MQTTDEYFYFIRQTTIIDDKGTIGRILHYSKPYSRKGDAERLKHKYMSFYSGGFKVEVVRRKLGEPEVC